MSTLWNFFGIFKISLKMTNEESSHSLIFLFSLSQIHVFGIVGMITCDFFRLHSLNPGFSELQKSVERNGNNKLFVALLSYFMSSSYPLAYLLCLFSYFSSKDGVHHIRLSRTFCHFLSHGFLLSSTLPVNLEPLH